MISDGKISYLPLQHNVYLKYFAKKVVSKKKKFEKNFFFNFSVPLWQNHNNSGANQNFRGKFSRNVQNK